MFAAEVRIVRPACQSVASPELRGARTRSCSLSLEMLASDRIAEQHAPHRRPRETVNGEFVVVLELHHRATSDLVRLTRAPQRPQLPRRVRIAPAEAPARRDYRRLRLGARRARDRGPRRPPVHRQIARLGEELLQAQRRAGWHRPFDLAGRAQPIPARPTPPRPRAGARRAAESPAPLQSPRGEYERVAVRFAPVARRSPARAAGVLRAEHFAHRLENVRWIAVAGAIRPPAAGWRPSPRACDGGNQLTCVGAPTFSHGRAAAATSVLPVAGCVPSEIEVCAPLSVRLIKFLAAPVVDHAHRPVEAHVHL